MKEIIEIDVEKRYNLALMIQTPESYGSYNKRIISEIDSMEVDEEISRKRIKIQSQGEIIIQDEQN